MDADKAVEDNYFEPVTDNCELTTSPIAFAIPPASAYNIAIDWRLQ